MDRLKDKIPLSEASHVFTSTITTCTFAKAIINSLRLLSSKDSNITTPAPAKGMVKLRCTNVANNKINQPSESLYFL